MTNSTISDVLLVNATNGARLGRVNGISRRCIRLDSSEPFQIIAFAENNTGISPHRVTASAPIHPMHAHWWDWRIVSFVSPETGPLLPRSLPCVMR